MKASLILTGNAIFDSINKKPFSGYIAIKENRILKVGHDSDYAELVGIHTEVHDYQNKLIMAGFHDSHTHLIMAGMFRMYVNLAEAKSEEETVLMVKKDVDADRDKTGWIIGFGWYHVFWDNHTLPTCKSLDKYFQDRPVCLLNAEAHGAWINSKAMEIANITKNTPDPYGGKLERDKNGNPTGFLYDTAVGLVGKYAFAFTLQREKQIIRTFMDQAKKYGITSIDDVQPYFHGNMGNLSVYDELDKNNELTIRIHAAPDLLGDLNQVEEWRKRYHSDKLRVEMLKQFLDGVSTTHTALVLEEYDDEPGNYGISLCDVEAIKNAVPEGHRRGFSIKLHSCGDKSARMGLDYYEDAIKRYGKGKCRHAIEHIEMLSPEDLPRFKQLGIIPSVQPEHLALTQTFAENPYPTVLGDERASKTWAFKSLYDTAGILAIGSDCPVVDNNPFLEIYRGITRIHNDGEPQGGWNPTEKLSLFELLRSYTYGGAYGVNREDELGSLSEGNFADIIVIDRNLFEVSNCELYNARVEVTIMDGKIIYNK